jgi:hypothetical protein
MGYILMCTLYRLRKLWVFKIIFIYVFFLEFINNEKKLEEYGGADDDVYTLHV